MQLRPLISFSIEGIYMCKLIEINGGILAKKSRQAVK